jgi:hypothetical protein
VISPGEAPPLLLSSLPPGEERASGVYLSGDDLKPKMLSNDWWFWALIALIAVAAALGSSRYRAFAAGVRRAALRRNLIDPGPGQRLDVEAGGFASDLSWLSLLLGAWVVASPWIWGYDDTSGAIATDVITGAAVLAITLIGLAFPSFLALNVLAGLWLVVAPWLVGYGDDGGAVGLSDTICGLAISTLAIAGLAASAKRVAPGTQGPIGRIQTRDRRRRP